jgi:hypothetical protein
MAAAFLFLDTESPEARLFIAHSDHRFKAHFHTVLTSSPVTYLARINGPAAAMFRGDQHRAATRAG